MKVKVSEATGSALDWMVAKCEGVDYRFMESTGGDYNGNWWWETRDYSTNPSLAWPIIEREQISIGVTFTGPEGSFAIPSGWHAYRYVRGGVINPPRSTGPTTLIAAMRCFVASKLGDEVDVPEELI